MEKEQVCCPVFDPTEWEDKIHDWQDKLFVKEKVFTLFYVPINFGGVMRKLDKLVSANGGVVLDNMCLSDHTSKWSMDVYLAVDKEIAGLDNTKMTGKFYSRVYEGDFKNTEDWAIDFQKNAKEKGFKIKKWYMWYTTCPKCAKKYGKNYTVIMGAVE